MEVIMRRLIWTAAIVSLIGVPAASFAQQTEVPSAGQASSANGGGMIASPDPGNCGTPGDWKACPPLPRHPLTYYPGHPSPSASQE
jgi:hypothetical protein